ncbi:MULTISPECIES: cytochrome C biosynthesis protein [unclassified Pseudonocardia]|uniref:tetratricopeptide repeat protein n=1 Tax=unclassified Pseudonocardia TaxID=2619320 RepID=UPI00095C646F|nr:MULTISPECIES: cytochrome C biosynthesis protein [unclassified Pseudonocardia]MBN9098027.1 cytochrome C biosynthesis protein [Pseudonocardia sp.]OJY54425.1 MAG: hypothetical protein BGP03_23105 [Pseudonocardia sp. 73-21]
MTASTATPRAQLHELADQAVRDIVELDAQVAAGEIPAAAAEPLRHRYEATADQALRALDAGAGAGHEPAAPVEPARPGRRAWTLAYSLAGVAVLVAGLVLLPDSVLTRPTGGFVTGNEVMTASGAPPLDPTARITDTQLEQVVAANPGVVGMRLALADRYVAEGTYDPAMRHYLDALRREPRNAEGLAHLGWLLWLIRQEGPAWDSVNQALAVDPTQQDGLWFRAVIALDGRNDPATALATLAQLQRQTLAPEVAAQVQQLADTARGRAGGSR